MDYSLTQFNQIRAEVIKLTRNQEARKGNWDIITLMNRGFGGNTDDNALKTIAAEIHNIMKASTGQQYPMAKTKKQNNKMECKHKIIKDRTKHNKPWRTS